MEKRERERRIENIKIFQNDHCESKPSKIGKKKENF